MDINYLLVSWSHTPSVCVASLFFSFVDWTVARARWCTWVHIGFIKRRRERPPTQRCISEMVFATIKLAGVSRITSKLTAPRSRSRHRCVWALSTHQRLWCCLFSCSLSPSALYMSPPVSSQYGRRETNYILTLTVQVSSSAAHCWRQAEKRERR